MENEEEEAWPDLDHDPMRWLKNLGKRQLMVLQYSLLIGLFIMVSFLSYEQGVYSGMEQLCPGQLAVHNNGSTVCASLDYFEKQDTFIYQQVGDKNIGYYNKTQL